MKKVFKSDLKKIDIVFYKNQILPIIPLKIFDFHTHIWKKQYIGENKQKGKYLVIEKENRIAKFIKDINNIFPNIDYNAIVFGFPSPETNLEKNNDYIFYCCKKNNNLFPLMLIGKNTHLPERIIYRIKKQGFYGYKVNIPWYGNNYGKINIKDMIGDLEMRIADEFSLIVLLHVPTEKRLEDKKVQQDIKQYAQKYPNAKIVLAHCGRCYLPDQMKKSIGFLKNLDNVYLDTAMVMDPQVIQIVLENIDSKRLLFATDFPIAKMRGRRVYVKNHWVDIVVGKYPKSQYRIFAKNIDAVFMAWEIILAIKRGSEMAGISENQYRKIFYENGITLLKSVKNGKI